MQELFTKLNIYEQLGYFVVGGTALFCLKFLLPSFVIISELNTLVLALIVYLMGHTIQAVANIVVKENKEDFSENEKKVLEECRSFFGIKAADLKEVYQVCYMYSLANDSTGHVELFNAYYSLYRGWFVVFSGATLITMWQLIISPNPLLLMTMSLSLGLAILFNNRRHRFFSYARSKTLQNFLLVTHGK